MLVKSLKNTTVNCGAQCLVLMMLISRIRTAHVLTYLQLDNFTVIFGVEWHSLWG